MEKRNRQPGEGSPARTLRPGDPGLLRQSGAGAAAGAAATVLMTGVMWVAQRAGWLGTMPPKKIVRGTALRLVGKKPSDRSSNLLAAVAHVAFGAGAGAVFAMLSKGRQRAWGSAGQGALFGSAVWGISYAGWIPLLGLMPPPPRDRPGRPVAMLTAHLVYGTVLGALTPWLVGRQPSAASAGHTIH